MLDFVWSTPEFEQQLGGVKGLPSYYVLDSAGRIRAVIKGHSKDTLGTLGLADRRNRQAGQQQQEKLSMARVGSVPALFVRRGAGRRWRNIRAGDPVLERQRPF